MLEYSVAKSNYNVNSVFVWLRMRNFFLVKLFLEDKILSNI